MGSHHVAIAGELTTDGVLQVAVEAGAPAARAAQGRKLDLLQLDLLTLVSLDEVVSRAAITLGPG